MGFVSKPSEGEGEGEGEGFMATPGEGLETTKSRSDNMKGVLNLNIEPFPLDRQRNADGGMTPEERALRKQWVEDQFLTDREPVRVTALIYRNNFKRLYGYPLDMTAKYLISKHYLHPRVALISRYVLGKFSFMCAGLLGAMYYFRHNQAHWEKAMTGWVVVPPRQPIYPGDEGWDDPDYGKTDPRSWSENKFFYERNVFLCPELLKTSSESATEISRRNAGLL